MNLLDEEIGLLPADLATFDKNIAPAPYGAVSKAHNLDAARRRGNARVRALLERFWATRGGVGPSYAVRDSYTQAIKLIKEQKALSTEERSFRRVSIKPCSPCALAQGLRCRISTSLRSTTSGPT
jgi:hypothetical protein